MEKNSPEIKACSKCGKSFECLHSTECWCMDYEISPENLKLIKETYSDCLCPKCLSTYKVKETKRCS
jgi:hypothetical protein